MNKKILGQELSQAINRTAQSLAAQSFNGIRAQLEREALDLLKQGSSREAILRVMVTEDLLSRAHRAKPPCDLA